MRLSTAGSFGEPPRARARQRLLLLASRAQRARSLPSPALPARSPSELLPRRAPSPRPPLAIPANVDAAGSQPSAIQTPHPAKRTKKHKEYILRLPVIFALSITSYACGGVPGPSARLGGALLSSGTRKFGFSSNFRDIWWRTKKACLVSGGVVGATSLCLSHPPPPGSGLLRIPFGGEYFSPWVHSYF